MVDRIEGREVGAEHALGVSPRYTDLNWQGISFDAAQFERITSVHAADWQKELESHKELFATLRHNLPAQLEATRQALVQRLTT
jgi:phosphoenolpyruvate carboxykinase (GTP)